MTVAWSHSRLNKFRQCPRKSYCMDYAPKHEKIKEPPSPIFERGNRMHKAMEDAIRKGVPLPASLVVPDKNGKEESVDLTPLQPVVDAITRSERIWVEEQMAFTEDLRLTSWFADDVWCRVIWDAAGRTGTKVHMVDWKGLALDTPLPTPSGWTTMGDVAEGDQVFDSKGRPCTVVGKSEIRNRPCYRLTFSDTSSVVCDDEHLWVIGSGADERTVDAKTLYRYQTEGERNHIVLAQPLQTPHTDLPIHPYVLGVWLGDGKHTSGEITNPEDFIWDKIQSLGYDLGLRGKNSSNCRYHTVKNIRGHLQSLGVRGDKHIPIAYLRASYAQRLALLQGLMDSDGSANPLRKQAIFTSCSKRLSDDVMDLLCSLGQRPLQSTTTQRGFGLTVTAYPISFRPQGINPFSLPRKADRIDATWGQGRSWCRKVVDMVKVESVPTQCIAVDSFDSTYLCTKNMIPTHNSGKPRPDSDQLELFAASVFTKLSDVDEVHTYFVFLEHRRYTHDVFYRSAVPHIWQKFGEEAEKIVIAKDTGVWDPCPGTHCRWCPVPKSKCGYSQVES